MLDNLQIPNEAITETVKSVDRHIGATYDNLTYATNINIKNILFYKKE